MKRDLASHIGIFADRGEKAVRLWVKRTRTLLTPSEARGIAFTLLVSADRAEARNTPGVVLEEERE